MHLLELRLKIGKNNEKNYIQIETLICILEISNIYFMPKTIWKFLHDITYN